MLLAQGLEKSYGSRKAVAGFTLQVRPGEILGLLGPNGAGKSTTIAMLAGLIAPDAGRVAWTSQDQSVDAQANLQTYKARIGLVPQDLALYDQLSAQSNLELFGALYGLGAERVRRRACELLERVGLSDRARDRAATFSGGMKRRLHIACALVHDPEVLLLDEPTAGVDPQSRNAIFDHLEELRSAGKALIYTTHYMEEVERLADRIVIVDHGSAVAQGTLSELLGGLAARGTLELECEGAVDASCVDGLHGVSSVQAHGAILSATVTDYGETTARLLTQLAQLGIRVLQMRTARASLEDVFLGLTGRQLRD